MSIVLALVIGFAAVSLFLTIVWAIQVRTRNAGMVDPVWSWSLGFLGVLFAILGPAPLETRVVLGALAGFWGLRLGTHLFLRNIGKPEDGRYKRLRDDWGTNANRNMFWFFQFQALMALLLSAGFVVVAWRADAPGTLWTALAVVVWLVSVVGEGLADWQLEQFKKNSVNKGKVCSQGLWHYSRHPNYFFESLHWLTYVFLAIGSPWVWVALAPPAIMAWLLLKMSGIPITEKHLAQSRPGYADYIKTTSAFIPWPPKKA
jgi:steroid 5-alpha reductase family enzyme